MATQFTEGAAYSCVFVTLGVFALTAAAGAFHDRRKLRDRDEYFSARNSQSTFSLAMTYFASGIGGWVFYSVSEVGTYAGSLGIIGYAASVIAPLIIFDLVSPYMRRNLPVGVTLNDFVRERFGRPMEIVYSIVSFFNMFIYLVAELTTVGGAVNYFTGINPLAPVLGVSIVTLAYSSIGGLPISLITDQVQGVAVIVLLVVLLIAIIVYIDIPPNALAASGAGDATSGGVIAFVSLVIGVTSATMFHSGFWQRLWAAGDERKLRHGIFAANVMTIAVLILMGFSGMLALALYGGALFAPNYVAYLSTFMLIQQMPMGWHVIAVVAVVCMVSSTADTLQNAFAATFSAHPRMTIPMAQLLTVALNVPAIVLATLNLSVLSLFNLGNLLCCSALVPVAMGLWPRTNPVAALVGVGVGIVTVVLVFLIGGEVDGLGAEAGVARIYFQYDVTSPTLVAAFVLSPALSGLTTLVGSLIWKHEFAGFAATKAAAPGAQPKAVAV